MDTVPAADKFLPAVDVAVVGGGPAGLRAAEVLSESGFPVALYEGKPSTGRKFLVAGRGGLNLTHSEPSERFIARYVDEPRRWQSLLAEFGPEELRAWAASLGVETYVGTSGRVFPRGQQAAILLRRWIARLRVQGVQFHVNHRLKGLFPVRSGGWALDLLDLRTGETRQTNVRVVVLALGGASWPQTGSDGAWPTLLRPLGIPVADWQPANCGFEVSWSAELLAAAEGMPLKNIAVRAGDQTVSGELLVTRYGLEGGALYQLGRTLRALRPPRLTLDLKPTFSVAQLVARVPAKHHASAPWPELRRAWKLSAAAEALLRFQGPGDDQSAQTQATATKQLTLELRGPRPIQEAISSAGGVLWNALDENLMCIEDPGLFAAGEMIDWEAPTGGYLLQGCFATGTRAGRAAGRFLRHAAVASSDPLQPE